MDKTRPPMAKILVHSAGMGTPTPELVRQRAEELATINGHVEYTEADWQEAKLELHGGHHPDGALSEEWATQTMVSEPDMLAVDAGHHADRVPLDDERNLVEELWQEGMEEAEHDRMLAAAREVPEED